MKSNFHTSFLPSPFGEIAFGISVLISVVTVFILIKILALSVQPRIPVT